MDKIIAFGVPGLFTGAAYAIAASGLVLTYTTTRVFNIAHGAFGMLMAFIYWDFSVRQGMPVPLALFLVLGVVAPATGWFVYRFIAKGLTDAPVGVTLVVTVGLFVGLIGLAQQIYPPESRVLLGFFNETSFQVGDAFITAHQLITVLCSIAVAIGLYALLNRTRTGTAMRAAVDNPELLRLFGGKPDTVGALSWAIGISLAALGGILLASTVGLDYFALTLLVINAYAAAMVGRLKSLPLTFAGAMALGLGDAYIGGFAPPDSIIGDIRPVLPALFLFAIVVLLPTTQLRIGQVKGIVGVPVPSMSRAIAYGGGLLFFVAVIGSLLSDARLLLAGTAITYAIVMLSLVLLTGYGGYVSLAQFTFAGVGALAYAKLDQPNLLGLLIVVLISGAVGALVALPTLRLTGLYLALSTLAFGVIMDKLVFQSDFGFGFNDLLPARRLSLLGFTINSTAGYVWLMAGFFVLTGLFVLAMRRGPLGRMLIALRDSPAACGTLGLDARWFRVGLFAISAAIAGLAGALLAGLRQNVGAADFTYFESLPLLLLAVVFGVTSVTGAALGGVGLMLLPVLQSEAPEFAGLLFVIIGFGAVALGRDPNGLASLFFKLGHRVRRAITEQVSGPQPETAEEVLEPAAPPGPLTVMAAGVRAVVRRARGQQVVVVHDHTEADEHGHHDDDPPTREFEPVGAGTDAPTTRTEVVSDGSPRG